MLLFQCDQLSCGDTCNLCPNNFPERKPMKDFWLLSVYLLFECVVNFQHGIMDNLIVHRNNCKHRASSAYSANAFSIETSAHLKPETTRLCTLISRFLKGDISRHLIFAILENLSKPSHFIFRDFFKIAKNAPHRMIVSRKCPTIR